MNSSAEGTDATANGQCLAYGAFARSNGPNAYAFGAGSQAYNTNAIAFGSGALPLVGRPQPLVLVLRHLTPAH